MHIFFDEESGNVSLKKEYEHDMESALSVLCELEGFDPGAVAVSVSFVSEERIREINREYRDTDKVTDVLSFPQFDDMEDMMDMAEMTGEAELGDVVICMDRARAQAEEYGHSLRREVIYLFVHSILHLSGYDHMEEDDKVEMRVREEEIMSRLGIGR